MDPHVDPLTSRSTDAHDPTVVVATPRAPISSPVDDLDDRKGMSDVTIADLQQLRWGPIVAGALTALGIFVLLTLPAIAIGLQDAPGTQAIDDMGPVAIVVTSAIALIAFFVGGFVSTWSAGVSEAGRSLVNGFLVWALWLVALAVLGALGIGAIAGTMGDWFGQLENVAADVSAEEVVDTLRASSLSSFLALALTALAAALGGIVGAREDLRGAWVRMSTSRARR